MPRRSAIRRVMVIGSGPIVIGQACEFDYSGTQAIKALKEEGIEVVLLNSNPATIMTDPGLADRTYIEPIDLQSAEQIIAKERPDSLLPTMGGQTALNLAIALHDAGVLKKYGVELIGASIPAIKKAEDRQLFKQAMEHIGLSLPKSRNVSSVADALSAATELGYPVVVRPSFTLAGTGGGVAADAATLSALCGEGLRASPIGTVLIEESVLGWKEIELEVMRDTADNAIVVCSIENLDPMGVHTGDSITVAPVQTLTDKEYQRLRTASLAIMREIGVDTGGSNVQFALDPKSGRMVVIEMNPRVSRSSALASKATGYPIARIAAKLAIGYTLDELKNEITRDTAAAFEPTIDYVVVKVPRFNFEKFPHADSRLTTSMRSVGEVMAFGRTFEEAWFKALGSLEVGRLPLEPMEPGTTDEQLRDGLAVARPGRPWVVHEALRRGWSPEKVSEISTIDPWFLRRIARGLEVERTLAAPRTLQSVDRDELKRAKALGLSDRELGRMLRVPAGEVAARRAELELQPVYKRVDTCAGEFESFTPFLYSTWDDEDEVPEASKKPVVMILGSGPIRIGQGIEFDYCCVQASLALRDAGFDTVMVNCNPETVSTDWDTSSRLYFEPVTAESVLAIAAREAPMGVIVQLGGQTPLRLAIELEKAGLPILGTTPDAIDLAEDRERFAELIDSLGLRQADWGVARSLPQALRAAERIGYPVMVRPSYVLGGRAMEVVADSESLERYMREAVTVSPEHPVLIDRFLSAAAEVDLDLVADKNGAVLIGGVLEHVEEAGIHSGDAASTLPPHSLSPFIVEELKSQATALAAALKVVGLMNVQFAVQGSTVFILEVNPRASRTVPFVSKATGVPLARIAALVMAGKTLAEVWPRGEVNPSHVAVKESVFPFNRFPGVDVMLGPEMRSTGEVMGLAMSFPDAFARAQRAAGVRLPSKGVVFISVHDEHKQKVVDLARRLVHLGFTLQATRGTAQYLSSSGLEVERVNQVREGSPHVVDLLAQGRIALLINTYLGAKAADDGAAMRREALMLSVPYYTTLEAAGMVVAAIEEQARGPATVRCLQDYLAESAPV